MEDKDILSSGYLKGYRKALRDVEILFEDCDESFKAQRIYNSKKIPLFINTIVKEWELLCEYGGYGVDVFFSEDGKSFKMLKKGEIKPKVKIPKNCDECSYRPGGSLGGCEPEWAKMKGYCIYGKKE